MARPTIAALQAELAALRHNCEVLATERDSLRAEVEALSAKVRALNATIDAATAKAQDYEVVLTNTNVSLMREAMTKPAVAPHRSPTVFEFDPNIRGDFLRASKLARELGGTVRRARS